MPTLSREHRRFLENTVAEARRIAVAGAEQALRHLGVHKAEGRAENRALREKLRAPGGTICTTHLLRNGRRASDRPKRRN
jgi:hypothetical protein